MFTPKIWENTYIALKSLIEGCYYSQLAYSHSIIGEEIGYWKEFCTVRMTSSRRSGHTTAIAKVAPEYFSKALMLAYNQAQAENLAKTFLGYYKPEEGKYEITIHGENLIKTTNTKIETERSLYTFGSINCLEKFRGHEFEAIIIDCAFMLSQKGIGDIYSLGPCMIKYPQKFFIFLQ